MRCEWCWRGEPANENAIQPLDAVIMEPPTRLVGRLVARAHVECVIWRALLLLRAGQHGKDRKAHGLHAQGWSPVVREDRKADVAVGVHMRMHRDVVTREDNLRRGEGVLIVKAKLQQEPLALVERGRGTFDRYQPDAEVFCSSVLVDFHSCWCFGGQLAEFFSQASLTGVHAEKILFGTAR